MIEFLHERISGDTSPEALAANLNNLFLGLGRISLIAFSIRENEYVMSYRRGGNANYTADVLRYDPTTGLALKASIDALLQGPPFSDRRWPVRFFDLTPRQPSRVGVVFLAISEIVLDSGDGSYPNGDQEFRTSRLHIVEAQANLAPGGSGLVRLLSGGGRFRDLNAHNRSGAQFDSGARGVGLWDRDTQALWVYPSCC